LEEGVSKEAIMNWDQLSGEWKQMQAQVKSKWAKLTDDDLKNLNAKKDMLVGKIQARYGILKDEAEQQLDEWMASLSSERTEHSKGRPQAPPLPAPKRSDAERAKRA
jgi:uncharacterized protein YjbJ (UPF0337 family)